MKNTNNNGEKGIFILDDKTFVIRNPKIKGRRINPILSKINDYKKSAELKDTANYNLQGMIEVCKDLNINFNKINDSEKIDELEQKKLQDALLANPDYIAKIYGNNGDTNLLFDCIIEIIEYYKEDNANISEDDFTINDILKVVKYLKNCESNIIPDFLLLRSVK